MIVHLDDPPSLEFGKVESTEFASMCEFSQRFTYNHYASQLERLAEHFRSIGDGSVGGGQ